MDENGENREPQLGRTIRGRDPDQAESPGYLSIRNLFLAIFATIIIGGLVHICITVAFFSITDTRPGEQEVEEIPEEVLTNQPGLQVAPADDLQALLATEDARLTGFEVDEQSGRARLPIEAAMDLIAEQGLPVTPVTFETPFADDSGFSIAMPQQPAGTPIFQGTFAPIPEEPERTPAPEGEEGSSEQGAALFQELGCSGCHTDTQTDLAPTLVGLYGEPVTLDSGQTVTADEQYLSESILHPNTQIVEGYPPIMPSYDGRVNDEQLAALVAYIASLGD